MHKLSYNIINGITFYRIVIVPVLVFLIFTKQPDIFKLLLPISFFTDFIDGFLARKFKVTSILGARLDSIGDDLTILTAMTGLFVFEPGFIRNELVIFIILFSLFVLQIILAIVRYGRISSFHTYLAKTAALLQGMFLILFFLLPAPVYFLFYTAVIVTAIELVEEIIIVILLPNWKINVKGLYWLLKKVKVR